MAEPILADEIANHLRREILRGKLLPGSAIKERDNAAELGVSRTPMREAIRILAKEGLVELRPSRSPIVTRLTLREAVDSIDVLSALEMLTIALACRNATPADLAAIRAAEQRLARDYDDLDQVERFERDMAFHVAIARASHNPALIETHAAFLARLWHARFQSARSRRSKARVLRQHAALAGALERRDTARAQAELGAHLDHLLINVRAYFEALDAEDAPLTNSG